MCFVVLVLIFYDLKSSILHKKSDLIRNYNFSSVEFVYKHTKILTTTTTTTATTTTTTTTTTINTTTATITTTFTLTGTNNNNLNSNTTQLFICSLTFATFSVELTKPENRLQLSFILLLTTITFKFVVSQTLPRISYLTYLVGGMVVWRKEGDCWVVECGVLGGRRFLEVRVSGFC